MNAIIHSIYNNLVRPRTPGKIALFNGVAVRDGITSRGVRLFDINDVQPDYKQEFIEAIHSNIRQGDDVTLIGGGRGVTAVHALRAGAGHVTAYEAASVMLPVIEETVDMDWLASPETVDIKHALVAEGRNVYGDIEEAEIIEPTNLNLGDVLVMDCEGAEEPIIEQMNPTCHRIIVETHPAQNAPTERVRKLIRERGYEIIHDRSIESWDEGKRVLVGQR